jgi:hypothetical protein
LIEVPHYYNIKQMADVPIQVEVAELKGRVTSIERDTSRSIDSHAKSIDRQERRYDEIEAEVKALQLDVAVIKSDTGNGTKLKWLILTALITQLATIVVPFFHPTTSTPPEATRRR